MKKCLVMLSTYNGEKYLTELMDSVLNQSGVEIDICIRDDGSQDNTREIINNYLKKYKNIKVIYGSNVGYANSFWWLIKNSEGYDYYALCDQDDIWKKDKILRAIQVMNDNNAWLYTSDVTPINNSFTELDNLKFLKKNIVLNNRECFQKSILPGCTFVFNDSLLKYLKKYDGYMESHDWAIYAIATVFGKVICDEENYILYRIHDSNAIGNMSYMNKIKIRLKRFFKKSKCTRSKFAKDFFETYKNQITDKKLLKDIELLANYKESVWKKIKLLLDNRFKGFIFKIYILLNRV